MSNINKNTEIIDSEPDNLANAKNENSLIINSINLQFFLDNNGNLYFETNGKQYQVIINGHNFLELDEGDYRILNYNEIADIFDVDESICFDEINTFDTYIYSKNQQLPTRKFGLTSALYTFEYYKGDKKLIYTEAKQVIPSLVTIQIYTNGAGETFMYSRETGCRGLVKYNFKLDGDTLVCLPEINKENKQNNENKENDSLKIPLGEFKNN